MKAFFAVSEEREVVQSLDFAQRFGLDLERVPQYPGVVGDVRVVSSSDFTRDLETALGGTLERKLVEFKSDNASVNLKTFFIEYESTSDGWTTRRPSGHEKAITSGCILVLSSGPRCLVFNLASYTKLIDGVIRERTTKFRKNGNRPNSFTRGRIVPLKHAIKVASFVYKMSTDTEPPIAF